MRRITKSYYNYYREKLDKDLEKIILSCVYRNKRTSLFADSDFEKTKQIGDEALLYCLINFDKNNGCPFNQFLYNRVFNIIRKFCNLKYKNKTPLSKIHYSIEDKRQNNENKIIIKDIVSCLNDREKDVIDMYFWGNYSTREIGKKLGISYVTIHYIKQNALKKMKEFCND